MRFLIRSISLLKGIFKSRGDHFNHLSYVVLNDGDRELLNILFWKVWNRDMPLIILCCNSPGCSLLLHDLFTIGGEDLNLSWAINGGGGGQDRRLRKGRKEGAGGNENGIVV